MQPREVTSEHSRDIRHSGGVIISGMAGGHAPFHWFLQSFVVVLPEIQSAFNLSAVGVGGIVATREVASGVIALPAGVIVDMLRRHWGLLLTGCIMGSSMGALMLGLAPVYPVLLIGMAMVAMSHSVWHLAAASSLSYHFSHRRGLALSFHGVGGSVGDVLGPLATGALLGVLSWRGILSVYAAVPFFMAFLAAWSFSHLGKSVDAEEAVDRTARLELTKQLVKNRTLWGITLVRGLKAMSLVALITVLPLYFDSELDFSPFRRGVHIGLLIAIGIAAKPVAGYFSDRWGRKQVLVPGLIWSCAICLLLAPYGQGATLTVLIALLGMFVYPDQPILMATVLDIVGANVSSTAMGLMGFISFLISAMSPLIAGGLYETMGIDATLYYVAALFGLAAAIFAFLPLSASKSTQ